MDHLTTTLHQLCELIALDNVDSPSDGAEVMAHPAVRDMVIDATGEVGVLRYRIRLKPSASEPSAEAVSPLALAVDLRFIRRGRPRFTGCKITRGQSFTPWQKWPRTGG